MPGGLLLGMLLVLVVLPRFGGAPLTEKLLELLVGLLLVGVMSRRPDRALLLLLAVLPVQTLLLALILRAGLPVAGVKALGLLKEAVVMAMVVAAVREGRRTWDRLDRLVASYIGLVSVYLVLPIVVSGVFATVPFSVRALAWRYDALFAVAFLAARRITWHPLFLERAARTAIAIGLVSSACALLEFASPSTWSTFLIHVARVRFFRAAVQGNLTRATDELSHISVGGHDVIRVGGAALSPLLLGFVLLVPLALSLERITAARGRVINAGTTLLLAAALLATLTRSAILGGLLVAAVTVRMGAVRLRPGRIQVVLGIALVAVLVAPLAGSSTVVQRATSAFSGDQSAAGHRSASLEALSSIVHEPLGRGLGTNPVTGQRFHVARQLDSENAYLQVGTELGLLAMLVFVGMFVSLLLALRRRARAEDGIGIASPMLAAGVGLGLVGFFLHVWLDLATALVFWSLAGVALAERSAYPAREGAGSTAAEGRVALGRG